MVITEQTELPDWIFSNSPLAFVTIRLQYLVLLFIYFNDIPIEGVSSRANKQSLLSKN